MDFFDKVKNALGFSKKAKTPTSNAIRNFKYLDDLIHSGLKEIVLDSDIILSNEKSERINLDIDDIVIDGNGHTIDACGKTGIFHCTGKNITIKNIILKNGFSKGNGGAIYDDRGELTISHSKLTQNTAKSGGAIYNNRGELTISHSKLTENTSKPTFADSVLYSKKYDEKYGGGAICNGGKLTITDSQISRNKSKYNGGAIYNEGKIIWGNTGEMTVSKSTFSMNSAQKWGVAILNAGEMAITESEISEHELKDIPGASKFQGIINNQGELTIDDSVLSKNTANDFGLILNHKFLKCNNCEFSNNSAVQTIFYNFDSAQISNSNFKNNESEEILYSNGNLTLFQSKFTDNNVANSLIFNQGKSCIIQKTVFKNINSMSIINSNNMTLINPEMDDEGKTILNKGYILLKKGSKNISSHIYGKGTVDVDMDIIPEGEKFDFGYLDRKIHESDAREIILDDSMA